MGDENNENTESDTLAAHLAAAWEESETESEIEETDEPAARVDADDEEQADEPPAPVEASEPADAPKDAPPPEVDAPPSSLSPAAREAWKDTPQAVRDDVAKRERDYQTGIQKYAENARRAETMDSVLRPYAQYLQMNGGPGTAIQNLLNTGASLQSGAPAQKAQIVASLIQQFGVDINALDNILAGEGVPRETQQQSDVQQQIATAMQPFQQFIQNYQGQQQQHVSQQQTQINEEISAFAKANEFYADVSDQMADLMEMASKRGQTMGLQESYDMACKLHPQISKIVQSREAARNVQSQQRASSSITGSPGGPGEIAETSQNMRQAIESAWDEAGNG